MEVTRVPTNGENSGKGRSKSPDPVKERGGRESLSPPRRERSSPRPSRSTGPAVKQPPPNKVIGVFGLSIRTRERDLEEEFGRIGQVEKVTIVYDQRSERSRGFGFIEMGNIEDAAKAVEEMNGVDLHGRRIRVDYSATERPHNPTPGQYMGFKRNYDSSSTRGSSSSYPSRSYDRSPPRRSSRYDPYEDRRSRYSRRSPSPPRRRRDYSRSKSPARRPTPPTRGKDTDSTAATAGGGGGRW